MCTQVALVLPTSADVVEIGKLVEQLKLGHGVAEATRWDDDLVVGLIPWHHCFCGTDVASLGHRPEAHVTVHERDVEKLRKKGWSEARIARRAAAMERDRARRARDYDRSAANTNPSTEAWVDLLRGVRKRGLAARVGIVAYESRPDPFFSGETIPAAALRPEHIEQLESSEVLTVV